MHLRDDQVWLQSRNHIAMNFVQGLAVANSAAHLGVDFMARP
jgi:hypothetical protein